MSLIIVNMGTSLVIHKIERGLTYLRVSGEFECGLHADQSGYPKHKQRSGLSWSVR